MPPWLALYHSAFKDGELPASLKHLAAYLVTYASGYPNLAAEEQRLAIQTADDTALVHKRLSQVEAFAKSRDVDDLVDFDEVGVMAMRFAECSISYPNQIPGRLVYELSNTLKAQQIAELISSVASIGFAQRWTGIWEVYNDYMLKQGSCAGRDHPGSRTTHQGGRRRFGHDRDRRSRE